METLQASVALKQVFDLVFSVFLRQTPDEELAWSVINLCGDDTHGDGVDDRDGTSWLDYWVFVKFGRATYPQHDIIIANSI